MENDTLGAIFLLKVSLITSNFESTNLLKSFPIFDLRRCSEQFTQTFCLDYTPLDAAKQKA